MNFKFFLCCCTAALLAVALGFGAAYVTGSTLAGVAVSSLGAALGAFAVGRALWGGAVSHAADVVSAIAAKPTDVVTTDDSTLEPLFARLDDLRKSYKNDKEYKDGILRGLPMPYLLVDTKERALSTNRACLNMLEIDDSIESCMGKTLAELFYNDPTRKTAVGKSIATGECFKNLEVTIGGHKGGKVNVLANVFPIYNSSKECIGGMCVYVDMTALNNAQREITEKNRRMAEVAQALEETMDELAKIVEALTASIRQSDKNAAVAAGQLGEMGVNAKVKTHFWKRFGNSIMLSLIQDAISAGTKRFEDKNTNGDNNTTIENTSSSVQNMAEQALTNSINIPPTAIINQGTVINISVARDIDFSSVYGIKRR